MTLFIACMVVFGAFLLFVVYQLGYATLCLRVALYLYDYALRVQARQDRERSSVNQEWQSRLSRDHDRIEIKAINKPSRTYYDLLKDYKP